MQTRTTCGKCRATTSKSKIDAADRGKGFRVLRNWTAAAAAALPPKCPPPGPLSFSARSLSAAVSMRARRRVQPCTCLNGVRKLAFGPQWRRSVRSPCYLVARSSRTHAQLRRLCAGVDSFEYGSCSADQHLCNDDLPRRTQRRKLEISCREEACAS